MRQKLVLPINATEKHCYDARGRKCRWFYVKGMVCTLFYGIYDGLPGNAPLKGEGKEVLRCSKCLDAATPHDETAIIREVNATDTHCHNGEGKDCFHLWTYAKDPHCTLYIDYKSYGQPSHQKLEGTNKNAERCQQCLGATI